MQRSADIIGLTLSELAFLIIFGLILMAFIRAENSKSVVDELESRTKDLAMQLSEEREIRAAAESKLEELAELVEQSKRDLKSEQTPSCQETGFYTDFLFRTTITRSGRYRIGRSEMTLAQVHERFKGNLSRAENAGCVHRVEVWFGPDVSTEVYVRAYKGLGRRFYLAARGQAGD